MKARSHYGWAQFARSACSSAASQSADSASGESPPHEPQDAPQERPRPAKYEPLRAEGRAEGQPHHDEGNEPDEIETSGDEEDGGGEAGAKTLAARVDPTDRGGCSGDRCGVDR